jgi:hypothetical protein
VCVRARACVCARVCVVLSTLCVQAGSATAGGGGALDVAAAKITLNDLATAAAAEPLSRFSPEQRVWDSHAGLGDVRILSRLASVVTVDASTVMAASTEAPWEYRYLTTYISEVNNGSGPPLAYAKNGAAIYCGRKLIVTVCGGRVVLTNEVLEDASFCSLGRIVATDEREEFNGPSAFGVSNQIEQWLRRKEVIGPHTNLDGGAALFGLKRVVDGGADGHPFRQPAADWSACSGRVWTENSCDLANLHSIINGAAATDSILELGILVRGQHSRKIQKMLDATEDPGSQKTKSKKMSLPLFLHFQAALREAGAPYTLLLIIKYTIINY